MIKKMQTIINILTVSVLLVACSQGGGETGTGFNGKPIATEGVITGFGSVYVNGVRYETSNASVFDDDESSNESALKVGMLVTLEGEVDDASSYGVASTIRFDRDVDGEVLENNYVLNKTLNVLGQTIYIDKDTIFKTNSTSAISYDTIAVGNIIEVSGYSDGSGSVYATRLEVKADARSANEEIETKGLISQLNSSTKHFFIGQLEIAPTNTTQFKNMQVSDLANGMYVKVKSTSGLVNGVLQADEIKLKQRNVFQQRDQDDELEIEGVVTQIISGTEIYVNGRKVFINENTELEDINLLSISVGSRVEVKARVGENEALVAVKIEGKKISKTSSEGFISAIDSDTKSFSLNGMVFYVNNTTRYNDDSDSDEQESRYFNFNNLNVGDELDISFYVDTLTGNNIVSRLEREDNYLEGNEDSSDSDDDNGQSGSDNDDSGQDVNEWEGEDVISSLDTLNLTFIFNGIPVNYSRAEDASLIANGALAEIKGVVEDGIWYALEIDIDDE